MKPLDKLCCSWYNTVQFLNPRMFPPLLSLLQTLVRSQLKLCQWQKKQQPCRKELLIPHPEQLAQASRLQLSRAQTEFHIQARLSQAQAKHPVPVSGDMVKMMKVTFADTDTSIPALIYS